MYVMSWLVWLGSNPSHFWKSVSAWPGGLTRLLNGPRRPASTKPCMAWRPQQEGRVHSKRQLEGCSLSLHLTNSVTPGSRLLVVLVLVLVRAHALSVCRPRCWDLLNSTAHRLPKTKAPPNPLHLPTTLQNPPCHTPAAANQKQTKPHLQIILVCRLCKVGNPVGEVVRCLVAVRLERQRLESWQHHKASPHIIFRRVPCC